MASLNEIKERIASVKSTLKITSAMKMVSSAKLIKAQKAIGNMLPYEKEMRRILVNLMKGGTSPLLCGHEDVKRVILVCFSSNQSLCGAFNSNVIRMAVALAREYRDAGVEVEIYSVGRKMHEAMVKEGFSSRDLSSLAASPDYEGMLKIGEELLARFNGSRTDKVELVYNHCKSMASQPSVHETLLPFSVTEEKDEDSADAEAAETAEVDRGGETDESYDEYILEPSRSELLERLVPKVVVLKLYAVLLDTCTAEHSARTMAMQIATDNGNDLLSEITLEYNKGRQQRITNEILDLAGGVVQ